MPIDFNSFSSLGAGSEAFALMEEDLAAGPVENDPLAEAEVKVTVRSGEDQQQDAVADEAAAETETVADAGAELFKDIQQMAQLELVLKEHDLHPSLYAFINGKHQLDRLLNVKLPGVESLSATGTNEDVKRMILPRLQKFFTEGCGGTALSATSIHARVQSFFEMLNAKLHKLQAATDTVVQTRKQRVAEMIAKMEEEDTPEEAEVNTNDEATTDVEDGGTADTTPAEGDTEEEVPADAPAPETEEEKEPTDAEANTAEECSRLMKAIAIEDLPTSTMITSLSDAAEGKQSALQAVVGASRDAMRALAVFRHSGRRHRRIRYNKTSLLSTLHQYQDMLNNWSKLNQLFYGCGQIQKEAKKRKVSGAEGFSAVLPLYHSATTAHNYIQTAKKAMDAVYYNLRFAVTRMIHKKYAKKTNTRPDFWK